MKISRQNTFEIYWPLGNFQTFLEILSNFSGLLKLYANWKPKEKGGKYNNFAGPECILKTGSDKIIFDSEDTLSSMRGCFLNFWLDYKITNLYIFLK